jgi:hypothetical protein
VSAVYARLVSSEVLSMRAMLRAILTGDTVDEGPEVLSTA